MSSLADRLAPSTSQARPSSAGRGGRPAGMTRTSSTGGRASPRGQQRSAPYTKNSAPAASAPSSNANAGNVEAKWEHDLFGQNSDLYAPQLNTSFGKAKRSASGGVFGKALDGISSSSNVRTTTKSPPLASPSGDLFGRFGIESPSGSAASTSKPSLSTTDKDAAAREREERLRDKAQWEARQRLQDEEKRLLAKQDKERQAREQEEQRRREELLRQEALDLQAARRQTEEQEQQAQQLRNKSSQSTLVVIQNLLDGTTPEDVKAALGDFGEILKCEVLESNGDTVSMQLEFTNRVDAEKAVKQLDGALADGKTLRLSIKERPKPTFNARPMGIPLKGAKIRQEQNAAPRQRNGAAATSTPQAAVSPAPEMQMDIPAVADSKLHSDRIAMYDERAAVLDRPEMPRYARSRGQKPQEQKTPNVKPGTASAPSIAERFGIQPKQERPRQYQQQQQSRGGHQSRPRQDGAGLLGRLGGARRNDDSMDTS